MSLPSLRAVLNILWAGKVGSFPCFNFLSRVCSVLWLHGFSLPQSTDMHVCMDIGVFVCCLSVLGLCGTDAGCNAPLAQWDKPEPPVTL